jgi:hypothetical protein
MGMVKLRPSQQKVRPFKHLLLDTAQDALPDAKVDSLVVAALKGDDKARQELIVGHLSMLRHTIGRYLYHWPLTRRFRDDMISAGLQALTHAVNRLEGDTLGNKTLGQYLLNNICATVEDEIARLRGICPAPPSTNRRRSSNGDTPIFGHVESDIENPAVQDGYYYYIEERFEEIDVLDMLDKLREESDKRTSLTLLLDEEYWGLSDTEVSKKTGIPRQTISWYRSEMLKRYRELTGG